MNIRNTGLLLAIVTLSFAVGCGSDDSTGPGFSGPSVQGTWRGTWQSDVTAVMILEQDGADVTGTIKLGSHTYALTGKVTSDGEFSWGAMSTVAECQSVGALDLPIVSGTMEGVAIRSTGQATTDGCGGRYLREQGWLELTRP